MIHAMQPRRAPLLATLLLAACASVRDVDEVVAFRDAEPEGAQAAVVPVGVDSLASDLAAPAELPGRDELRAYADARLEAYDERCRALLGAARAQDADYDTVIAAARALVFNADLRIQSHLAFAFDPADLPEPKVLIDAEDDVPAELQKDVRSLVDATRTFADRALELREGDPAARLFSTLGTSLYLWSLGPLQALTSGDAGALPKRIKGLAADHPDFEGAAPLRLKGRFQSRAPWPYRDVEEGVATLEQAVERAPLPLNLLFLGDARWLGGDREGALEAWRRATAATADEETRDVSPLLREIARLRVLAATRARG